MTNPPDGNISVSSTDVLIAMLAGDLRGSWAEGRASRSREHTGPAGSGPLPAFTASAASADAAETEDPAR